MLINFFSKRIRFCEFYLQILALILLFLGESQKANANSERHLVKAGTGNFSTLSHRLQFGRSGHNVEQLSAGRLLIAGGAWGDLGGESRAEILNLRGNNAGSSILSMAALRSHSTQATLNDGRILFMGGATDFEPALRSSEFFDPKTEAFTAGPDMNEDRFGHTSVKLGDGRVFIFGGTNGNVFLDSIEVFNPKTQNFEFINARLKIARANHTTTLLRNQFVVIVGGETGATASDPEHPSEILKSIEIFDTHSMTFVPGNLTMNNDRLYHTTTTIDDHRILIAGGLKSIDPPESSSSIEILNLEENSVTEAGFALHGRSVDFPMEESCSLAVSRRHPNLVDAVVDPSFLSRFILPEIRTFLKKNLFFCRSNKFLDKQVWILLIASNGIKPLSHSRSTSNDDELFGL